MRTLRPFLSAIAGVLLFPAITFAQAFGEYGKAVGGIPHGKALPVRNLQVVFRRATLADAEPAVSQMQMAEVCHLDWWSPQMMLAFIHARTINPRS